MAADTRDRILDALEKLLLVSGVAQVTLEGVAAEAGGVSKGGLLYHFPQQGSTARGDGPQTRRTLGSATRRRRSRRYDGHRVLSADPPMRTKAKNSHSSGRSSRH